MAPVVLYASPGSTCTGRVLMCMFEAEQDFELKPVNLAAKAQKKPEYLEIQPFGQVPAIQDGDLTLFESRAVLRYIADKNAETGLYGKTSSERALVEQWLEVESCEFSPVCAPLVKQIKRFRSRGQPIDEAAMEQGLEALGSVLDVYEKRLTESSYLAGDFFSIADLSHVVLLHFLVTVGAKDEVVKSRNRVNAWWKDISNRPSWRAVLTFVAEYWKQAQS